MVTKEAVFLFWRQLRAVGLNTRNYYIQIMKIWRYITTYHYRVESKTLRQKFRESSLQRPVRSSGTLMYTWDVQELPYKLADWGSVGCHTTNSTSSTFCPSGPTRNPVSSFSYDLWIAYWGETRSLGLLCQQPTPHKQGDDLEGKQDLPADVPPCRWVALPTG